MTNITVYSGVKAPPGGEVIRLFEHRPSSSTTR